MNKINLRGSGFLEKCRALKAPTSAFRRSYVKDDKNKDKDKEVEVEEPYKARKGVLHDKQQSIQEESYFHKEELEQLKGLKKKLQKEAEEKKKDEDK